ncbi:MAG: nucleotidyl transferase AbiEii/AbiGii toxin family protein [Fibrobacterota bacterium]
MAATSDAGQRKLLAKIADCEGVKPFYLAGGTALTFQLGHRLSVDLDFFSPLPFQGEILLAGLRHAASTELTGMERGTLHINMDGIPVSFFEYPYPVLELKKENGFAMASIKDIGLMKLMAIQQRGLRKDFIDLYAICKTGIRLVDLLELLKEKYTSVQFDRLALLKALVYFGDAVEEVPLLVKDINWDAVKKFFRQEVRVLSGAG